MRRRKNSKNKSERRELQKKRDSLKRARKTELQALKPWLKSRGSLTSSNRNLHWNNKRERNKNSLMLSNNCSSNLKETKRKDLAKRWRVLERKSLKCSKQRPLALKVLIS